VSTVKEFKIKDHDDFIFPQHIIRGLGKSPEEAPRKTALELSREPAPLAAPTTGFGEAPPVGEAPAPAPTPPPPVTGAPTGVGQGMPASHGGIASVAHVSGDANVLTVKGPAESPTGQHLVPQTAAGSDPNYYATPPQFNKEKGYWYSGGTNPPSSEGGWAQGQWVKQGHAQVHGQRTNFWVWYPPYGQIITITPLAGHIYALTQSLGLRPATHQPYASLITDAFAKNSWRHVFSNPDYFVASFTTVPPR
jgi:hypothetical protein